MNKLIELTSLDQPGADVFSTLTEAQLRNRLEPEKGVFIAESPKVIRVALDAWMRDTNLRHSFANGNTSRETLPTFSPDARTFQSIQAKENCSPA